MGHRKVFAKTQGGDCYRRGGGRSKIDLPGMYCLVAGTKTVHDFRIAMNRHPEMCVFPRTATCEMNKNTYEVVQEFSVSQ